MATVGAVLFTQFSASTQLLGDGYLLTRELAQGFRKIANEPLSLWVLSRIHNLVEPAGVSAFEVYTVWSIVSGVVFLMYAFRNAPAAVLAPFSYFGILTAFCFGWFIFGEFPVDTLFPGILFIVVSGMTIIWREQRKGV